MTNSRTDVAQIFGHLLGYFEKLCSQLKTYLASFWATFDYNMWSYCPFKPYLKQNFILFRDMKETDGGWFYRFSRLFSVQASLGGSNQVPWTKGSNKIAVKIMIMLKMCQLPPPFREYCFLGKKMFLSAFMGPPFAFKQST